MRKKEKKKKGSNNEEKLLKLKDLSDNRLLSLGETAASSKEKAKKGKEKDSAESQEQSPAADGDQGQQASSQDPAADADGQEAAANTDGQENSEITLVDLPSMDTLTTEEEAPKETEIDLSSALRVSDMYANAMPFFFCLKR